MQQVNRKIKYIYDTYYTSNKKDFVELLQLLQSGVALAEVERGITELCHLHPNHVTTDKIKALCAKYRENLLPLIELSENGREITERARQ